jgi:cupin 2 domain-containing protein
VDDLLRIGNLKSSIPPALPEELLTVLVQRQGVRIERIVSRGHTSPPGFWYDQDESEFVVLLQGHARIEIEGEGELDLRTGDFIELPAHVKHRVTWTDPQHDTVWLAVFYSA